MFSSHSFITPHRQLSHSLSFLCTNPCSRLPHCILLSIHLLSILYIYVLARDCFPPQQKIILRFFMRWHLTSVLSRPRFVGQEPSFNIHNYITAQQDHVPLNWTRRREREPIPDLPLHNGKVDTTHRFPPPVVTINHLCLYIHIYACGDRLYSPRAIVIVILSSYTIWLGSKCKLIPKWSRNLSQPVPICSTMCLRSSLEASNPKEVLVLSQEPTIHSNHHHSEVSSRYRNLSAVPRSQGHLYLPNW